MRSMLAISTMLAVTAAALSAQAQTQVPANCRPAKNPKVVICTAGGPLPPASMCIPNANGKRMVCRAVPPGTILTPAR